MKQEPKYRAQVKPHTSWYFGLKPEITRCLAGVGWRGGERKNKEKKKKTQMKPKTRNKIKKQKKPQGIKIFI